MSKLSTDKVMKIIPGLILCLLITYMGIYGAELIGLLLIKLGLLSEGSQTPISGIFVAILFGIIIRNTIGLKHYFIDGVTFALKYALRIGIVLLGLRLSLFEAFKLGVLGIPLIIICIFTGLFGTLYLTKKLKQSSRLGALIAGGTGICGVTAIMAISPVIKAKENEILYAIANITIFGLTGMIFYPFIANFFFASDPIKAGMFLGTAIHDTAQVTGAALIYNQAFDMEKVIDVATVTKLTRNLFIIAIIPLLSYIFYKGAKVNNSNESIPRWYSFVPLFVIGFLLLATFRTIGDMTLVNYEKAFGLLNELTWSNLYTNFSSFGTTYLLGMAMAGVGLSTNFSMFKDLGIKPFYIGFASALLVGVISFTLIFMFGHYVSL